MCVLLLLLLLLLLFQLKNRPLSNSQFPNTSRDFHPVYKHIYSFHILGMFVKLKQKEKRTKFRPNKKKYTRKNK